MHAEAAVQALQDGPLTSRNVATRARMKRSTAHTTLNRLIAQGVVTRKQHHGEYHYRLTRPEERATVNIKPGHLQPLMNAAVEAHPELVEAFREVLGEPHRRSVPRRVGFTPGARR